MPDNIIFAVFPALQIKKGDTERLTNIFKITQPLEGPDRV